MASLHSLAEAVFFRRERGSGDQLEQIDLKSISLIGLAHQMYQVFIVFLRINASAGLSTLHFPRKIDKYGSVQT